MLFLAAISVSGLRISLRCWHQSVHDSRGNQLGSSSKQGSQPEGRLGLVSVLSLSCLSLLLARFSVPAGTVLCTGLAQSSVLVVAAPGLFSVPVEARKSVRLQNHFLELVTTYEHRLSGRRRRTM
jgi:hypothetical protein